MTITKNDIKGMSMQEKQQLLDMIWESFEESGAKATYEDDLPAESEKELQILKERLDEYKKDPAASKKWDEAFRDLKSKYE